MKHNGPLAVTVGREPPIAMVLSQPDGDDNGFTVLFSDAPELAKDVKDEQMQALCLACLIEEHPDVGRALDLAKQHGSAERYPDAETGEWRGRDHETGEWAS